MDVNSPLVMILTLTLDTENTTLVQAEMGTIIDKVMNDVFVYYMYFTFFKLSLLFQNQAGTPGLLKLFPEKFVSVPIYLSLSVRTDPCEQTILVAKVALIQEI